MKNLILKGRYNYKLEILSGEKQDDFLRVRKEQRIEKIIDIIESRNFVLSKGENKKAIYFYLSLTITELAQLLTSYDIEL